MDITIHRSGVRALIEGVSAEGKKWVVENLQPSKEELISVIQYEYAKDLAEEIKKAGLDVDLR